MYYFDNEVFKQAYSYLRQKINNETPLSQVEVILLSELYGNVSRLAMGQVSDWITFLNNKTAKKEDFFFIAPEIYEALEVKALFYKLGFCSFYGIFSKELGQSAKISCDIHQVLRQFLAFERSPKGGTSLIFDDPIHSSSEKLISTEKIKD